MRSRSITKPRSETSRPRRALPRARFTCRVFCQNRRAAWELEADAGREPQGRPEAGEGARADLPIDNSRPSQSQMYLRKSPILPVVLPMRAPSSSHAPAQLRPEHSGMRAMRRPAASPRYTAAGVIRVRSRNRGAGALAARIGTAPQDATCRSFHVQLGALGACRIGSE